MYHQALERLADHYKSRYEAAKPKVHPSFLSHFTDAEREAQARLAADTKKKDKEKRQFASAKREIDRLRKRNEETELDESAHHLLALKSGQSFSVSREGHDAYGHVYKRGNQYIVTHRKKGSDVKTDRYVTTDYQKAYSHASIPVHNSLVTKHIKMD